MLAARHFAVTDEGRRRQRDTGTRTRAGLGLLRADVARGLVNRP